MSNELVELMTEVVRHVQDTDSIITANRKRRVSTYPIPFFGDLPNASVVTVGVNPAATEFADGRWPAGLDAASLTERLVNYFDRPPHSWFAAWEEALQLFGGSYRKNAAHVDVSPRATISAAAAPDTAAFERMLAIDLPWMVRFLETAPKLRLLMMAGSTSSAHYLNEFIAKNLDSQLGHLEGSLKRPLGRGKVKHHVLAIGPRRIPVYFCGSSPSDRRNRGLLRERIQEDASLLRRWLSG
jgi:hypothetical protein